ncbi:hypothetical protein YC2023_000539 [Brassica napus]
MQYCRKGISSIASSPMSTRVKHAWEEQDGLVLGLAFFGGWFVKASINLLKRREDWYRVHRFFDDEKKRLDVPALQFDEDKRRCCRSWETPWLSLAARGARLQCRDFSSVSEKAVSKVYRYCFTAVFGGAGFLLGVCASLKVSNVWKKWRPGGASGFPLLKRKPSDGNRSYGRRGISSIASSPLSSRVKHAWEEQNKLVLGLAFIGGWFVKANINVFKRREDWYRVHRFFDEEDKRLEEKLARFEKELDDDV